MFVYKATARFAVLASVSVFGLTMGAQTGHAQTPPAPAVTAPASKNPTQTVGPYTVELRLPEGGIYAGEETDLEFRLSNSGSPDPVLGPPGIPRAKVSGTVTMPTMPSMPKAKPTFHDEGVPGDYGLVTNFAHGGEFLVTLTISPPTVKDTTFTVSFPVSVKDADPKRKGGKGSTPAPYTLDIQTNPYKIASGESATLTLTVKERATGKAVTKFDELHTVPMHLIFVKDDLSAFYHEHPTLNDDGTLTHTFSFPSAGVWKVWADCAPQNAGEMPLPGKIEVTGVRPLRVQLGQPTSGAVRSENGQVTANMKTNRLVAGQTLPLAFSLTDARGQVVEDLQPWLGALAHLIAIDRDGNQYVHAHPDETDPRNGRGGIVTFLARFPKAGTYKMWLQFQRAGSLTTVPFIVRVNDDK